MKIWEPKIIDNNQPLDYQKDNFGLLVIGEFCLWKIVALNLYRPKTGSFPTELSQTTRKRTVFETQIVWPQV